MNNDYALSPICEKCRTMMSLDKTGVSLLFISDSGDTLSTTCADVYKCRSCGSKVISGFGDNSKDIQEIRSARLDKHSIRIRIGNQ